MKFSSEDIQMIRKFEDIKNRGFYCDSAQLNDVYNRVLEKNVAPTSCGSCMRSRIQELVNALNDFERKMELNKIEEKPKAKVGRKKKEE